MSTIHDPRYLQLIERLIQIRNEKGITQTELAKKLQKPQSYVSKTETLERRLDVIELMDWLEALNFDALSFFESYSKNHR